MFVMVSGSQNQHLFSWSTCGYCSKMVVFSYILAHGCQWKWLDSCYGLLIEDKIQSAILTSPQIGL
jgi:hypothetical protein